MNLTSWRFNQLDIKPIRCLTSWRFDQLEIWPVSPLAQGGMYYTQSLVARRQSSDFAGEVQTLNSEPQTPNPKP